MQIIKQDITKIDNGVICHGVNCQGVMGSGVAKSIRDKWPVVYSEFKNNGTGRIMLGTSQIVEIEHGSLYIANCYTQEFYGRERKRYASVSAIQTALDEVLRFAVPKGLKVYSPMIGCGLGGLTWGEVKSVYSVLEQTHKISITVCTL